MISHKTKIIHRLLLVVAIVFITTANVIGQAPPSITGPACVIPGQAYTYRIIGGVGTDYPSYCITNGTLAGNTTCASANKNVIVITVTWNSGPTSGAIVANNSYGSTTYTINITSNVAGGTIAYNQTQDISTGSIPADIGCSPGTGGSCSSPVYNYQWQQSTDNITFSNISGVTSQSLSFSVALTQTTYYRRMVTETVSATTAYSDVATVFVYPPLVSGSISPAAQSITAGAVPARMFIVGVSGGTNSYSYQWQSSPDNSTWTNIPGEIYLNYNAPSLTATTYYRVVVTSAGFTGNSLGATITEYPVLTAGSINPSSLSLLPNSDAGTLALNGVSGGNGSYTYQWQSSPNNSTWTNISSATSTTYYAGILAATTYFRVVVTSVGTSNNSGISTATVTPPPLSGGIVSPQIYTVANGTSPGPLMANPASGGTCSGSYSYQWQQSSDNISFTDISGATSVNYTPGNLTTSTYYRRNAICNGTPVYTNVSTIEVVGVISNDQNYVQVRDITRPGITDFATAQALTDPNDVKQVTQYIDGVGREMQTVNRQASPLLKDVVTVNQYDPLGREVSKYLPYISAGNDGSYKTAPLQDLNTFNTAQFSTDQYFHGQIDIEASPLNRALTTYLQGNNWLGSNRGINTKYSINTSNDSVRYWTITAPPGSIPITTTTYAPLTLFKEVTTDEQGHQTVEYKDMMGLVVLKKVQLSNIPGTAHVGWLNTYYIYDDLNNLRFVLQPKCVELINSNWILTQTLADELCFRYEYDYRRRMIVKKIPGAGETQMVYDVRDRVVMVQDNNLRTQTSAKWLITKYDTQNRVDSTGVLTDNNTRSYHQLQVDNGNIFYPSTILNFELLTQAFYDDYSWVGATGFNATIDNSNTSNGNYFNTNYGISPIYASQLNADYITRSKPTGVATKVLGSSSQFLYAINFYDDRGRIVQTQNVNYTGGIDKITSQFDFNDKVLRTFLQHQKNGTNTQFHTVLTKYSYDQSGRMLNLYKNIDNASGDQLIATYTYNELGQLKTKGLGNSLETMVYDYNIRGWLLGANRDYAKNQANTSNKFGFDLGYDNTIIATSTGTTIGNFANPLFNGSIEGTVWKSAGDNVIRKYDYSYDNVNRLMSANFNQNNGSGWDNNYLDFSVNGLNYDANGNILSMNQRGFKVNGSDYIDQLIYTYKNNNQSNQLMQVTDNSNVPTTKLGDFHYTGTKQSTDYSYDGNGNLITDNNKSITGINYNYLDLTERVIVGGKGTIAFTYDGAGTKLKKLVQENGKPDQTTLYIAGFVYQNDTLQLASHEEGRIRLAPHRYVNGTTSYGYEYDFFLKDHLGNTRMVLTQEKDTTQYIATMEANYRTTENALFYNIQQSAYDRNLVSGYPTDNTTVPNDSLARVNGTGQKTGPSLLLKVMSGDVIDIATKSYYKSGGSNSSQNSALNDILSSLATGIVSATGASHGIVTDFTNSSGPLYNALNSFLPTNDPNTGNSKPKAYLNWISLDEQFKSVATYPQSGAIPVGSPDLLNTLANSGIPITKNGYFYVWVSNETPGWDVFFDNMTVKQYSGAIIEETHYYPFGLAMAGISSRAANSLENKNKFNGGSELQSKEFSDGTGLDIYDATFRVYDAQLGRFNQIDPLGEIDQDWSPYSYANDNPIMLNDPLGLAPDSVNSVPVPKPDPKPSPVTVKPIIPTLPTPDPSKAIGAPPATVGNPISPQKNSFASGDIIHVNLLNSSDGDVKVQSFNTGTSKGITGLQIQLLYQDNGSGLANFNWIQTIRTNDPKGGTTTTYNDPRPADDKLPFYWTLKELPKYNVFPGYNARFYDRPTRQYKRKTTNWEGELSLVGKNIGGKYVNIVTFRYGFQINAKGVVTTNNIKLNVPSAFQMKFINLAK